VPIFIFKPFVVDNTLVPFPSLAVITAFDTEISAEPTPIALNLSFKI
jgi:hypothetical protein